MSLAFQLDVRLEEQNLGISWVGHTGKECKKGEKKCDDASTRMRRRRREISSKNSNVEIKKCPGAVNGRVVGFAIGLWVGDFYAVFFSSPKVIGLCTL